MMSYRIGSLKSYHIRSLIVQDFMKSNIPDKMLQHLEYLRNLHLEGPKLGNVFLEDTGLLNILQHHPISSNQDFKQELVRLGDRFATIYLEAARNVQSNPPKLEQFDTYGRRIDKLHLAQGWKALGKYSAEDGLVALAYEEDRFKLKEYQRFGQLIALYLYQPSSGLFGCPLAMTDGAAYTLRDLDKSKKPYLAEAYKHLTSRTQPWTSGQWMTEKKGGSDVSNTETLAIKTEGDCYKLYGYKWFTSATDSQMTLGLGKIINKDADITPELLEKTKVSLFFIKMRKSDESLNNMEIIRLKDKLGTQQVPTAEILLKGTDVHLISDEGNGVKMISKMLTVTRLYNSSSAVSAMKRIITLSRDYASRRIIGKSKLSEMPLQVRVLAHLEVTHRANLIFFLKISELFSKEHAKTINDDEANILRVMTPILKLFTGKQVLEVATQGLESFGGMGYIEGSMLPVILRDAQVLSIWEGTTNVLCYDFVRALLKKENHISPIDSLIKFFTSSFEKIAAGEVRENSFVLTNKELVTNYLELIKDLESAVREKFKGRWSQLRTYCFGIARIFISILLQLHALSSMREADIEISIRWARRGLYVSESFKEKLDQKIGLDLNDINQPGGVGDKDSRGLLRHRF